MGISIEAFRGAYQGLDAANLTNRRLEVDRETKTSVGTAGGDGDVPLTLNQLEELPDGQERVADNIYLRGQLLTAIRDSLISLNVTGRTDCLDNEAAKTFFRQAEARLFGDLQTNMKTKTREFGVNTASGDLEAQTVKDLIEALDRLANKQRAGVGMLKSACPGATDVQTKAVTMITDRELVGIFGLTEKEAAEASFTDFRVSSDPKLGNRLLFSVNVPGRPKPLAAQVDLLGTLSSVEDFERFVKVCDNCAIGMGVTVAKQIPQRDLKQVFKLLDIACKGNMTPDKRCPRNYWDHAGDVRMALVGMIPVAYARARRLQPFGDITLKTWWKALDLKGNVPKERDAEEKVGNALIDALNERTMADFVRVNGLKPKEALFLVWNDPPPEGDLSKPPGNDVRDLTDQERTIRRRYYSFMQVGDFSYQARVNYLENPQYKFTAEEKHLAAMRLDSVSKRGTGLAGMITALEGDSRQYGTKYSFGDDLRFVQKKGAYAKDFVETLNKTHRFSPKQLALLVYANNNYEFMLQAALGGLQSQHNLDIRIEATGDPNSPNMRVTYNIPFLKGTEEDMIVTKQNIVHTVVYTQDGDSWGEELKFVDVRAEETRTAFKDWGEE